MATIQHADAPQADVGAARAGQPVSVRAVLTGLVCALLVCGVTPYNDYAVAATYLSGNFFPIGALAAVLMLVLAVNPVLITLAGQGPAPNPLPPGKGASQVSSPLPLGEGGAGRAGKGSASGGLPPSPAAHSRRDPDGLGDGHHRGGHPLQRPDALPAAPHRRAALLRHPDEPLGGPVSGPPALLPVRHRPRRRADLLRGPAPGPADPVGRLGRAAGLLGRVCRLPVPAFFCLATLLRKPWVEHERLAFPLVKLPVLLAESPAPGQKFNALLRSPAAVGRRRAW